VDSCPSNAILVGTDLFEADLKGTDLREVNLSALGGEYGFSDDQALLSGATMPDGSVHK